MKTNIDIVFDFDGTLAKSTPYHKAGWKSVLDEIGIIEKMEVLLPYEPGLKERFDSYRRIKFGFLKDPMIRQRLYSYFKNDNEEDVVKDIMNLKESFTIKAILDDKMHDAIANLAPNVIQAISLLKSRQKRVGIISSTRKTIIASFLTQCGILNFFDFIIGEESLTTESGILNDKPDAYAKKILVNMGFGIDVYIGDNDVVDREFADNCNVEFVLADYQTDYLELINKIG